MKDNNNNPVDEKTSLENNLKDIERKKKKVQSGFIN